MSKLYIPFIYIFCVYFLSGNVYCSKLVLKIMNLRLYQFYYKGFLLELKPFKATKSEVFSAVLKKDPTFSERTHKEIGDIRSDIDGLRIKIGNKLKEPELIILNPGLCKCLGSIKEIGIL